MVHSSNRMPIPRPPKGVRWILGQTATYDVLIALFASVIGLSSAANYISQGNRRLALLVGLGTFGVLVFTAIKQGAGLAAARKKDSTHELEGCLYTLHSILAPEDSTRLRLAIHVPAGEALEQVTEYVGVNPKQGRIGRQFPANAGIIGRAYREKDVFVGRRVNDDYESYVAELVKEWNYTEERARHLHPGVMEWMAVPFYDPDRQRVEAVLYLDATARGFFSAERQELILAAVRGIAVFIGKRYTQA
jgi:hypothetical protein